MRRRFSAPGAALASASLILACLFIASVGSPASAAGARASTSRTAVVDEAKPSLPPGTRTSYSKAEAGACLAPRRKLWVEGEGWVVRRVSACR